MEFRTQTLDPGMRAANLLKMKVTNVLLPGNVFSLGVLSIGWRAEHWM